MVDIAYMSSIFSALCPYVADLVLLMDASSSIGPLNYEKMKDFLKGVVSHFDIGEDRVRVGLITYNHGAVTEFKLNEFYSTAEVLNAFATIQDTGTGTTTHAALNRARMELFTPEQGDRPGVPNLALLLTDGKSTNPEKTAIQQQLLKDTGARIFVVGIGDIDPEELLLIASEPDDKYYAYVDTFDKLAVILDHFAETACDGRYWCFQF